MSDPFPSPEFLKTLHPLPEEKELFQTLLKLVGSLRDFVARKWNRSLPLGDYFSDRWERAKGLGFGEGSSIYDSSLVLGEVQVGRDTWIGPFTLLDGSGGLAIGDQTTISAGVHLYSHDSVKRTLSGNQVDSERAPTKIGSRCYLGPNVVVSMGVSIGDGSVIGANSLVLENIPKGTKAFGNPCRVVGPAE